MRRTTAFLLCLLLALPAASAGTQSDPEITDPAGDRQETDDAGPLDTDFEFPDVDLLAIWITQPDDATVAFHVQTEAPAEDDTSFALSFEVAAGPDSVFGSTANGTSYTIESTGTTLDAGPATDASQDGDVVTFTVPRTAIGASGGDIIENMVVSTSRSAREDPTTCPAPLCQEQTGSDTAPDTGTSRPYELERPAVVADAIVVFTGGTITETVNGTSEARDFTGPTVTTTDGNATVVFDLVLENTGSDVDTFNLSIGAQDLLDGANVSATLSAESVTLDPGTNTTLTVTAVADDASPVELGILVTVNSTRGAETAGIGFLAIEAPAPTPTPTATPTPTPTPTPTATPTASGEGRDPVVGEGTFLQDSAEALGFDDAFDDYAELVLLALVLLIVLLVVFLLIALAGGRWVRIEVTPKRVTARPGETAEFQVEVRNKKRRFHDALAFFDGDTTWKTGVLLKPEEGPAVRPMTRPGDSSELSLSARDEPGDRMHGTIRVQVPEDAADSERDRLRLNVVPVDPAGRERHRKAGRADVIVKAERDAPAAAPSDVPVRLSDVRHEPASPSEGDEVTTTATVENDGDKTLRLRLVLQLDGTDAEEQTVEVPPRSARAVLFPWVADAGSNRVRVQVYLA